MAASIAVVFVLAFGIGKLIYHELNQEDGQANKWNRDEQGVGAWENMECEFLQIEQAASGALVTTVSHPAAADRRRQYGSCPDARPEDMFLDNYSWIDETETDGSNSIARAMQISPRRAFLSKASMDLRNRSVWRTRPPR